MTVLEKKKEMSIWDRMLFIIIPLLIVSLFILFTIILVSRMGHESRLLTAKQTETATLCMYDQAQHQLQLVYPETLLLQETPQVLHLQLARGVEGCVQQVVTGTNPSTTQPASHSHPISATHPITTSNTMTAVHAAPSMTTAITLSQQHPLHVQVTTERIALYDAQNNPLPLPLAMTQAAFTGEGLNLYAYREYPTGIAPASVILTASISGTSISQSVSVDLPHETRGQLGRKIIASLLEENLGEILTAIFGIIVALSVQLWTRQRNLEQERAAEETQRKEEKAQRELQIKQEMTQQQRETEQAKTEIDTLPLMKTLQDIEHYRSLHKKTSPDAPQSIWQDEEIGRYLETIWAERTMTTPYIRTFYLIDTILTESVNYNQALQKIAAFDTYELENTLDWVIYQSKFDKDTENRFRDLLMDIHTFDHIRFRILDKYIQELNDELWLAILHSWRHMLFHQGQYQLDEQRLNEQLRRCRNFVLHTNPFPSPKVEYDTMWGRVQVDVRPPDWHNLQQINNCFIIGPKGSGKTATAFLIARHYIINHSLINSTSMEFAFPLYWPYVYEDSITDNDTVDGQSAHEAIFLQKVGDVLTTTLVGYYAIKPNAFFSLEWRTQIAIVQLLKRYIQKEDNSKHIALAFYDAGLVPSEKAAELLNTIEQINSDLPMSANLSSTDLIRLFRIAKPEGFEQTTLLLDIQTFQGHKDTISPDQLRQWWVQLRSSVVCLVECGIYVKIFIDDTIYKTVTTEEDQPLFPTIHKLIWTDRHLADMLYWHTAPIAGKTGTITSLLFNQELNGVMSLEMGDDGLLMPNYFDLNDIYTQSGFIDMTDVDKIEAVIAFMIERTQAQPGPLLAAFRRIVECMAAKQTKLGLEDLERIIHEEYPS